MNGKQEAVAATSAKPKLDVGGALAAATTARLQSKLMVPPIVKNLKG